MDSALEDSNAARDVIASLESAIGEIATVAGLIQAVADQTKLLARNATIEAARAGKGFGVVANEVKDLAAQTAAATARIDATVGQVTAGVTAAAAAVGGVADRLGSVASTQREVAASLIEQTGLAAPTVHTRSLTTPGPPECAHLPRARRRRPAASRPCPQRAPPRSAGRTRSLRRTLRVASASSNRGRLEDQLLGGATRGVPRARVRRGPGRRP
jgi:hypothetical protein